ncbi:hypothetical protein J8273_1868 [Carpediemonas membranifera]|uniref:WD40 repeat-like protein n=1 Tax=Carpediemonas membranifera TaxID=201153 RepID=A0A8J6B262_9EUKA|nr:hypothetical protein J8273_1868 [Carpediemonas membranifera]|eukprot:KAG9396825.1 hypothetical protein J8273_1868 [Carpediemonas membranifera]
MPRKKVSLFNLTRQTVDVPLYSALWVSEDKLLVGGGGGASTEVPNRIYFLDFATDKVLLTKCAVDDELPYSLHAGIEPVSENTFPIVLGTFHQTMAATLTVLPESGELNFRPHPRRSKQTAFTTESGKEIFQKTLAVSKAGVYAVGMEDGHIFVSKAGSTIQASDKLPGMITSLAMNDHGTQLFAACRKEVRRYDVTVSMEKKGNTTASVSVEMIKGLEPRIKGTHWRIIRMVGAHVYAVANDMNGRAAYVFKFDSALNEVFSRKIAPFAVSSMAVSDEFIAAGTNDGKVLLLSSSARPIHEVQAFSAPVTALAWAPGPDPKLAVTAMDRGVAVYRAVDAPRMISPSSIMWLLCILVVFLGVWYMLREIVVFQGDN